jgi:signal transduction histidine kinase
VLGGMLTSIKLDIQRISRRSDDAGIKAIVGDLLQLTQDSIDTVRSISEDLRPGGLDHLGLRSALEAELQRFSARTEIACELVAEGFEAQLSPARATAVYRICQEALTNIARHADASRVVLRLAAAAAGWRWTSRTTAAASPASRPPARASAW